MTILMHCMRLNKMDDLPGVRCNLSANIVYVQKKNVRRQVPEHHLKQLSDIQCNAEVRFYSFYMNI